MSEQGALLTAGGAVPRAGVPAGAQTMTFVGLKEIKKKKKKKTNKKQCLMDYLGEDLGKEGLSTN